MAVRRIVKTGRDVLTQVITTAYVFPIVGEGETANAVEVRALWDTGATHCMITPELAERMGLHSLGQKEINAAGGKFVSNIYEMGLVLSEDIWFPRIYFGESQGAGRFDIAIGMNAIQAGTLRLEGSGDNRTFIFEVGSR